MHAFNEIDWIRQALREADRPGLDRDTARRELGAADNEIVLIPLELDARKVDARRSLFLGGVVGMLDAPSLVVMPACAANQDAMQRFHDITPMNARPVFVEAPIARLWAGADVVFADDGLACSETDRASLEAWSLQTGTCLRWPRPLAKANTAAPPLVNTLWWAADLPDRVLEEPYA